MCATDTNPLPTLHILEDRVAQSVWLANGDVATGLIICFGLEATDDGRIRVPGGGCTKTEVELIREYKAEILSILDKKEVQ